MRLTLATIALAITGTAVAQVALPPHASTYNGFTRGYNFVAQTSFVIVALDLPTNAFQPGDTAGYLVRINGATALWSIGNPGLISTVIPVTVGDNVDVMGNWSPAVTNNFTAHNSYGTGPFATTIEGVPHTLTRCGWQWDIGSPAWVSTGGTGTYLAPTSGQLGRVLMYTAGSGGTVLATNTTLGTGCGVPPLTLAATSRPITGTSWSLSTTNVPVAGTVGLDIFGLSDPNLPDLGFLGAPGCGARASLDFLNAWIVSGTTHTYSLAIPANAALLNFHVFTQSAVLQPGVNTLLGGIVTSNGIDGGIGDF
jgi:hypothetical protein